MPMSSTPGERSDFVSNYVGRRERRAKKQPRSNRCEAILLYQQINSSAYEAQLTHSLNLFAISCATLEERW